MRGPDPTQAPAGNWREVFGAALRLGLTSFGGPIAHLGYFERSFVELRRWLSSAEYAALVALCQLLPGPTSSQVGFLIGYRRAGWGGAMAAFAGFTLPSALLMYGFAVLATRSQAPDFHIVVHGLMLAAVLVVAQAVWNMWRQLCPDRQRAAIALWSTLLLLIVPSRGIQAAVMILGAVSGFLLCRGLPQSSLVLSSLPGARTAVSSLVALALLLFGLGVAARLRPDSLASLANALARAGSLVFGGGHVVLPLLRELIGQGRIDDATFLTGYGFAQTLPGPLFSFAAFVGRAAAPAHAGPLWAAAAVLAIFLPGLLLAVAGAWIWARMADRPAARGALAGVNAAVVGVLAAALYRPVWSSAVASLTDVIVVISGFLLLQKWRIWPILIVAGTVAASGLETLLPVGG